MERSEAVSPCLGIETLRSMHWFGLGIVFGSALLLSRALDVLPVVKEGQGELVFLLSCICSHGEGISSPL